MLFDVRVKLTYEDSPDGLPQSLSSVGSWPLTIQVQIASCAALVRKPLVRLSSNFFT